MRSGLGWRSLDPVEAVADVHSIENKDKGISGEECGGQEETTSSCKSNLENVDN